MKGGYLTSTSLYIAIPHSKSVQDSDPFSITALVNDLEVFIIHVDIVSHRYTD